MSEQYPDKYREAEALLIRRKQETAEGKLPESRRVKKNYVYMELAEEYLKWAERQKSFISKKGFVKQLLNEFSQYLLRRFNMRMVEQYQTKRLEAGNKHSTVNRHLATLKHMFRKAVEWDMVEKETLKRVARVKLLPENNMCLRFLSHEECRELINACDSHLKPIVITALNTGMRKGEILGLKWNDVDLRHGYIFLGLTKNGERREIPISDTLRDTLTGIPSPATWL